MKNLNISIRKSAFFILLATALISMFSISILWIVTEIQETNRNLNTSLTEFEEDQKEKIKSEVKGVVKLINFTIKNNRHKTEDQIQDEILDFVKSVRLKYGGYIFINTYSGKALIYDGVKIIGDKDIRDMTDPDGLRIFDIELECAKKTEGDYFYYKFKPLDSFTPMPKVSYAIGFEKWEWIIGAGIYLNDITSYKESQKNEYLATLFKKILYIMMLFIVLMIILFAIANYLSGFMKKEFDVFLSYFNKEPDNYSRIKQSELQIDEFKRLAHSFNIMMQQREVSERLIKKERDKAQNYLNIAGVIILALDVEGNITLINKSGCKILGYKEEEIIGKNWFTHFVPVTEKQLLFESFKKVMNGTTSNFINRESKIISKLGKEHVIYWQNTTIYDEHRNIVGSLSSGLDQTKHKKVEADFMESETKYKLLFEKSSDPVLLINPDNVFLDCNKAALDILGYTNKEDFIGSSPDAISPEEQPDGRNSAEKAMEMIDIAHKEGHHRFEWKHIDKDGNPFYVDVSLTDIPVTGINFLYVVWRNITEKVKQENELIIAKEKAEESDRIKTSFINNIQHEIRTPLHAIMGFSQLLLQQNLSQDVCSEYYADIFNSGKQLNLTIDKIIEFARLQSGSVIITNQIYELKKLLVEVYQDHYDSLKKNEIIFNIEYNNNGNQPLVKTDIIKIKEILFHLMDNAYKFTEAGSITMRYSIEENKIIFAVNDTGIGVAGDEFNMIFEMFNTGTPFSKDKLYGGNGLGLSISKSTLEYLDGNIWVESEPKEGSTFYFSIPYRPVETTLLENVNMLNKTTLLVVSNSKKWYQDFSKIIDNSNLPFHTHMLKNGNEAIQYFQDNNKADLVIIDLNMPSMNGILTTKALKAFKFNLSVIIADNETSSNKLRVEDALLAGCVDYISTTNSPNEILTTVLFNLTDKRNLKI